MMLEKIVINKNKLTVFVLMLLLIIIQSIFIFYEKSIINDNLDKAIIGVSWVAVISFIIELMLWKKLTKEFFSPFVVFTIVLYIFTLGQTIGWIFNIDMGPKDLWYRIDHGMSHQLIFDGIIYSIWSISLFFLGAVIGEKTSKKRETNKYSEKTVLNAFNQIGKYLLLICIPAFILRTYMNLSTVLKLGYMGLFIEKEGSTFFQTILGILANLYQPCLLLLLISNKDKKSHRIIILIFMLVDVFLDLFMGGRSGAVMTVIGILLSYHYFIKPINKKKMVLGTIGGYFGMMVLNTVAIIRSSASKSIGFILTTFASSLSNVLGPFIGELGWSLSSLCWTMNLVPKMYSYRYGLSYLVSILSVIPSFVFGGKANNPTIIYANLGDWLMKVQNMSYGPGYTNIAEAFINFSWYGIIAMFIEGYIVAKFIARIKRENLKDDILVSTFQIIFIMTIMKSLVRSSLSVAVRAYILNVLPLWIILKLKLKNETIKNETIKNE